MRGLLIIIVSYVVTALLYFWAKTTDPASDWMMLVVQLSGLLGMISLSWSFILSIRHKILEKYLGGLDYAYKLHHLVGGLSLILLLQHPLFLVVRALPINQLSFYLVPGLRLDYTLGQLALYLMLFLLILTFYTPLPYRYWKWSHEWMGLVIILGGLHSFLVSSDTTYNMTILIWMMFWTVAGILSFVYKRFGYYIYQQKCSYSVSAVSLLGKLVIVSLKADDDIGITFSPGQYGFFAIPKRPRDEHAFTIWKVEGNRIDIAVKVMANFTKKLAMLNVGDKIVVRGPYGTFAEKMKSTKHAVWVAGGIGITPFKSMLSTIREDQDVRMFFCAHVMPDPVMTEEFVNASLVLSNFKFKPCETGKTGRLGAKEILDDLADIANTTIFLCGPREMMESLAEEIAKCGVRRSRIIYEDFGFMA